MFLMLKLCFLSLNSVFLGSASEIYQCIGGFPGEFQFQLRITHEVRPVEACSFSRYFLFLIVDAHFPLRLLTVGSFL